MKKYLKQLRTNLILRSMGGYLKDDSFFDEWDQNRIEFQGSNYEFHNVAVEIADFGYYDRACQLLDSGIAQYPNDTDLLADYLGSAEKALRQRKTTIYQISSIIHPQDMV